MLNSSEDIILKDSPLSERMRPQTLEEYAGQEHILAPGQLLRRAIEADRLTSVILYGPPGVGKTTLALLISKYTKSHFEKINAVASCVDDMRKVIAAAINRRLMVQRKTVLFIDEIHRFNKSQQDILMPDVEKGNIILIGATVSNPFFALNAPLLSRSIVLELKALNEAEILLLLKRAIYDKERGLGDYNIKSTDDALLFLARTCNGDGRKALNALEIAALTTPIDKNGNIVLTVEIFEQSLQKKQVIYDHDGDGHYDTISAFIKSMRGSDPDAAVYWLAKMIYAGEDPRFIGRRIVICASEDVGNADPNALLVANAAYAATEYIGFPEARIILAQAAIYVACAPKSNAAYLAIDAALTDIAKNPTQAVPIHLQDGSYKGAGQLGRGKGYQYPHDFPGAYIKQEYMAHPKEYYCPTEQGYEAKIKERQNKRKNVKE